MALKSGMVGRYVVVRTRSAGVHVGVLARRGAGEALLTDARRVWRWAGANTLHEIALRGVQREGSRVSEPVAQILLGEVIEVIACTADGERSLRAAGWSR